MRKTIHEVYHHGSDRRERGISESEFLEIFESDLRHHAARAFAGKQPSGSGCWVTVARGNGAWPFLAELRYWGRMEYGWSTFTWKGED